MPEHSKYSERHFKQCRFNPAITNILQTYPELEDIFPETTDKCQPPDGLRTYKMARYVIAMYDEFSPITKNEQGLQARKIAAATVAELTMEKDSEILDMIWERPSEWVARTITNYLRMFSKGMEYALIISLEETFWEFNSRLMQPVTLGDKDKDLIAATSSKTQLAQNAQVMMDMYKAALAKFYGDDVPVIEVASKIKRFTPEGVGESTKKK